MWQPDPDWRALGTRHGPLTVGLWVARVADRDWVVKRIAAPGPEDPAELWSLEHPGYWRREAEVALGVDFPSGSGLVAPSVLRVEEDAEGVTLWTARIERAPVNSTCAAGALGRYAGAHLPDEPWLCHGVLRARLAVAEERGGWPTLRQTPAADVTEALWSRRFELLGRFEELPAVPSHGDVVPANLLAPAGEDVCAIDWGSLGLAPVGADLGYYSLSCAETLEQLLVAYVEGAVAAGLSVTGEQARFGARMMAAFTVVSQAEWALTRGAKGGGTAVDRLHHPAVASYLRALRRQLPAVHALLG